MKNDLPLSKEAILHAQADMANIPTPRSRESAVIAHAMADMAALPPERFVPKPKGAVEKIKDAWNNLHIGGGQVKAMFKLGAHELTPIFQALPDSNIRPLEEPGIAFNETMPHIVTPEPSYEESLEHYSSVPQQEKDRSPSR